MNWKGHSKTQPETEIIFTISASLWVTQYLSNLVKYNLVIGVYWPAGFFTLILYSLHTFYIFRCRLISLTVTESRSPPPVALWSDHQHWDWDKPGQGPHWGGSCGCPGLSVNEKPADRMKTSERTDIDQIGRKLAVYGTYLCNRQHHKTSGHICSFLVCPGHDKPYSQTPRPEISITLTNQEIRKQRSGHLKG